MPDGDEVTRHRISGGGLTADILSYGAVLHNLQLDGHDAPLVLGFETFEPYLTDSPYFGAIAGRCANRVRDGRFEIDGATYQTDQNFLGKHMLHGGSKGIGKRNWQVETVSSNRMSLRIDLHDGEMGFPGAMVVRCHYACLNGGVFDIRLAGETDAPTLCNLAHHSYWNLDGSETLSDHVMQINADRYTVVDEEFIPTGESRNVTNTRFDFQAERPVLDEDIIDHNLCLSDRKEPIRRIGVLRSWRSGVAMEVHSTEPGIQVYDGFKMNVAVAGLGGRRYGRHAGVALEPQIWPDAVNHRDFPSVVLRPDETYTQHTQFRFSKG